MGLFDRLMRRTPAGSPVAHVVDDEVTGEAARREGNAALEAGRLEEALAHYDRFVTARPRHAPAYLNRGFVLLRLKRLPEAVRALGDAVALDRTSHEAQFFLARALAASDDLAGAESAFAECVKLAPDFVHAWVELGQVRERRNALGPARQAFEFAARLQGDLSAAWEGVARVALRQEDGEAALAATERCLALTDSPAVQGLRADAMLRVGRSEEALVLAESVFARDPELLPAGLVRANALHRLNRFEEATTVYEALLERHGAEFDVLSGLGAALIGAARYEEALAALDRALALAPEDVVAINNRALTLMQLLRLDEARSALRSALSLHAGDKRLEFALANAELASGNLVEGWRLYESRQMAQVKGAPRWQPGMDVAGKRVILLSEQGLGDTIQFARYVPEVMALGAQVVLQVAARLQPLFDGVWPGCEIVTEPAAAGRVDLFCPLLSLPHVMRRPEPLGMSAPYVRPDESRREHWRQRLGGGHEPLIGMVWSGNPSHPDDRRRSMPLELLRQRARNSRLRFVSLQLEVRDSDQDALARWPEMLHVGGDQRDMADTAALIAELDGVLCVDTSVAHVTGALGRPLFLMLQRYCDWRWGLEGDSTPWYPSAHLLRQPAPGDWASVVESAVRRLERLPARASTPNGG